MSRSKYPNSIDTSKEIPVLRDDIIQHGSKIINSLRSAVIQLEKTLGTNPQGFEGNTVSARLNASIDDLGNIRREALDYLNLLSGPISNSEVKSDANISEDKLKLDFSTTFLYNQSESLKRLIFELDAFLEDINSRLSSHLSANAENRHSGKNIKIEAIPKSISNISIKDSGELSLKDLLNKIFSEHFNYTGIGISQDNNSHLANQIYFENSNFNILSSVDVQSAIDELSSVSNSDIEVHQSDMHSNSKTKVYQKETEVASDFSATFSSYSYLAESKGTYVVPVTPFENDEIVESNFIKLVAEEESFYYNITDVRRDSSGLVDRISIAESISPTIQDQSVSVVIASETADFFSMNLARYEFYPKTNSSVVVLINPTAPTIYSNFLNLPSLSSASNTLSFDISGKDYTINCLPVGDLNINSVVEKINEELSGLAAPIIAYVSNENREKICISHLLDSNGSRYIKLKPTGNSAVSALGLSNFEGVEVYDSKFNSFFIFGKKHTSLNTKVLESDFSIDPSNAVQSLTGVNFSEYGVRKGDLLIIEGSTDDDGAYRISSLSDSTLNLDVPFGTFSGQAVGTGSSFYIKDMTLSYQDLNLTTPNFSSNESGLHSIYINKNKDIISKNIIAYEAQDETFHIIDAEVKFEEEVQVTFSINTEDEIEIDLDSDKRQISDFDESTHRFYTRSGNIIDIFVSSHLGLYNKISSNINNSINSSIKIFSPLDKFQNLLIGNVVFDNFTGTLRGSKEFGYTEKINYGSISKKDISGSFIKQYFEEYRASASKNSIFHGCEIYSVTDDGSSNYKFSISSGKAIVNGREIFIEKNEYFTGIPISVSNDRVYVGVDERGNVLIEKASISGCDCPFDLNKNLIIGVINYKDFSGTPFLELTDLRIFLSESGQSRLGCIYIDADKSKNNFRSINSAFKYAKSLSYISDKIGIPKVIFGPGTHTLVLEHSSVLEANRYSEASYKSIAEDVYDQGIYIDFPVIVEGSGDSTTISISSKWSDSSSYSNSNEINEGIIFIAGEDIGSGSYSPDRPLQQSLSGKVIFKNLILEKTKIICIDNTNDTKEDSVNSNSCIEFHNIQFTRSAHSSRSYFLKLFSSKSTINTYFHNKLKILSCRINNSFISLSSNYTGPTPADYEQLSVFEIISNSISTDNTLSYFLSFEAKLSSALFPIKSLILNNNLVSSKVYLSETSLLGIYSDFYESYGFDKNLKLRSYDSTYDSNITITPANINLSPNNDLVIDAGDDVRIQSSGLTNISSSGVMSMSSSGNLAAYSSGGSSAFGLVGFSETIIHGSLKGMSFDTSGANSVINTTNLSVSSDTTFSGSVNFTGNYRKSYNRNFMGQLVSNQQAVICYESSKKSGAFFGFSSRADAYSNMVGDSEVFGEFILPRKDGRVINITAINRGSLTTPPFVVFLDKYSGSGSISDESNYSSSTVMISASMSSGSTVSSVLTPDLEEGGIYVLYCATTSTSHSGINIQLSLTIEEYE